MFKVAPKKIRFGVVSITATTIDFGVLVLLHSLGTPLIKANYVSSSLGFIYSYITNRRFTFKTTNRNVKKELFLYTLVTLIGIWVIQPIIIYFVEPELIEFTVHGWIVAVITKLIAASATFFWNYFLYTYVVFKTEDDRS